MKTAILGMAILATSMAASAQPSKQEQDLLRVLEGTIYVSPLRESAEGRLRGCGIEFHAIGRDNATKRGGMVRVHGSLYWRLHEKAGLAYLLKLGLVDGLDNIKSSPHNAFVRSPVAAASAIKPIRIAAENPGYALFAGDGLDEAQVQVLRGILERKSIVVGFNRVAGQQDVEVVVDLTVIESQMEGERLVRRRSDETIEQFFLCNSELTNAVRVK